MINLGIQPIGGTCISLHLNCKPYAVTMQYFAWPPQARIIYKTAAGRQHSRSTLRIRQTTPSQLFADNCATKMLSTLLSLSALLVGSSFAQYPPAYLTATDIYGKTCTSCGMSQSSICFCIFQIALNRSYSWGLPRWEWHKYRHSYERHQQSLDRSVRQYLLDLQRLQ